MVQGGDGPEFTCKASSMLPLFSFLGSICNNFLLYRVPNGVQIGSRTFTTMNVLSNGVISLGSLHWSIPYLNRPTRNGFGKLGLPLIAPFWDDFHPSYGNDGRVYYQVPYVLQRRFEKRKCLA